MLRNCRNKSLILSILWGFSGWSWNILLVLLQIFVLTWEMCYFWPLRNLNYTSSPNKHVRSVCSNIEICRFICRTDFFFISYLFEVCFRCPQMSFGIILRVIWLTIYWVDFELNPQLLYCMRNTKPKEWKVLSLFRKNEVHATEFFHHWGLIGLLSSDFAFVLPTDSRGVGRWLGLRTGGLWHSQQD